MYTLTIPKKIAIAIAGLSLVAATAAQGKYPEHPIKFIVPSAAGGSPDVLSRVIANAIAQDVGQSIIVENKPGAAGGIGIVALKDSKADGYTVGYGNINTLSVNQALFKKLPYDVDQDLTPVGQMFSLYNVLIVPAQSDIHSVADLLKKAKAEPGKLSYGASGVGTTGHMGGELFKSLAKIDVLFVPYNSGPAALQDLIGGRLDYMFSNSSEAVPLIQAGKVRGLGVSSLHRLPLLPDVPTVDEAGVKGYETISWGGIVAPAGTPAEVITRLNKSLEKALQDGEVKKSLATFGAEASYTTPEQFKDLIDSQAKKWASIIEEAGIEKLD
ncbi:tripartite tricarboxylate transporter substrate binding protein [Pusillimonas sp. MFBS29]|uniref:Bug family tripartite tricarboxylate transporter substrate binding protein n=1 Tax=Pusillimonas sp. MFBS29 TaxID=2886690 RepID=UPI001D12B663|nr:tripartite tricarboxylate transporter substrate binding protein [Pusillimonas sp. MFBS29]MCC2597227.1 tripartite tricarboxylate transporter substrate binding protein [Pusillimonas sp. MFBS29]